MPPLVHREMWQKGCQHGDISISNLMYRGAPGGEGFEGVLIDWDLSILCDDSGTPVTSGAFQFTGTIPFAALDLIDDDSQDRKYRHEMESFVWTLLYLCLNHWANERYLALWRDSGTSATFRDGFISRPERYKPRQGFEDLYEFACDLMQWFTRYIPGRAHSRPNVDVEPTGKPPISSSRNLVFVKVPKEGATWVEPNEEQIWEEFLTFCSKRISE